MAETLVWYAAYGSNVDQARFLTYLTGGPVPGTEHQQAGARDPSPPRRSEPHHFDRAIRFAHHSPRWNGATAILDHRPGPIGALGRRYLITKAQFDDVVAQENRRTVVDLPLDQLDEDEIHPVSDRNYDGLLLLGTEDGAPVLTFTTPSEPEDIDVAAPSRTYLGTIARGILHTHELTPAEIARHLHGAPGVAPAWSIGGIEALME